ncbi:MmgE/PrpD family protein (plasmid) [Cupriavidus necator N-1]|uniref:MmgE/PrpD family protein n=2 Tax=Cupriavidus necator TaxID=106590 RepID=F8GXC3_CUPNN|nr:MmgE/PrpD family protein [Cupriavidus necator]AEI81993.1 MmgE/PrpD family protein [Cupriavidus necator N-1]
MRAGKILSTIRNPLKMTPITETSHQPLANARRLIEFLHGLGNECPTAPMEKARWCLLDALGCALLGARQPWSEIMTAEVLADGTHGSCTIVGRVGNVAPSHAALCNGTAMHGFELDDLLSEALIHPGAVIVPAVLAAAEAAEATGVQMLRAIAAGYEATARISMALGMDPSQRGFHKTSVVGPVAGAIAAGVAMRLPLDQLLNAVGLACSCASGVKNFAVGSAGMVKRMHAGRAAEAAVRMAMLARRGFTAPPGAIDGKFGLLDAFSGDTAKPALLDANLGNRWALDDVWVKVYPICGWIQGVVQLLLAMREQSGVEAHKVARIVVATSAFAVRYNGNTEVADTMDAQYSIPYCASVALTGDPGDPKAFSLDAIGDPVRAELAKRVELLVDPVADEVYPKQFACRVEVHLKGGGVLHAQTRDAHGTPGNPCDIGEQIDKFNRLASLSGFAVPAQAVVDAVQRLESLTSVTTLTRLLRP